MATYVWEEHYPPGISWSEPLPDAVAIESLLETTALATPEKIAMDFYDRLISYGELLATARRVACGLQSLGIGRGSHVGLHLPNTPHYPICFFAVMLAGARVVNFSPLAAPRELAYQLVDSEAEVMITLDLPTLYPQIAALQGTGRLHTVVVGALADFMDEPMASHITGERRKPYRGPGRELEFRDLMVHGDEPVRHAHGPLQDELAVLQYTGGTTGQPKGAMLTHANLVSVVQVRHRWVGEENADDGQRALAVLPFFHIFGLSFILLLSVATGGEMVIHLKFDAERVARDIEKKRVTAFSGVPTMYTALVHHLATHHYDLSSLRLCGSGGAPLPVEILGKFQERVGQTPMEGYGMTETTGLACMQSQQLGARPGTVGLPAPNVVIEVVDLETGMTVLPVGQKGEICIGGPQVMKGYWQKKEATEEAFRGGRFHTGDIGYLDEQGYLTLIDRKKDMILSGGYNVFPRIIEEAIYEHPAVAEVSVVGVPDPYRGQSAKAFVVLKPGNRLDYETLRVFLSDKLARYELPTELEVRASLPKTPVGKLSKKELVAEEVAKRQASS